MAGTAGTTGMIPTTTAGTAGAHPTVGAGMADGAIRVRCTYQLIESLLVIPARQRYTTVEPTLVTVAFLRVLLVLAIGATDQSQAIILPIT